MLFHLFSVDAVEEYDEKEKLWIFKVVHSEGSSKLFAAASRNELRVSYFFGTKTYCETQCVCLRNWCVTVSLYDVKLCPYVKNCCSCC